jgi:hypothetical protein
MNETTENNEKVQGPEVESRQRRTFLKSALVVTASMSRIGRGLAAWSVAGPVDAAGIRDLKTKVRGEVLVPGDAGYDAGRAGFELSADQRPAVVVMVESAQDVISAVNFARERRLGIGVQGTGHGITRPANGGLLVNTSKMKTVEVFPSRSVARVEPGAKWKDLVPQVQPHGLVALSGSSTDVGIVGYTLGGGTSWFARRYGYAANSVISAHVVTADGRLRHASEKENPDLFWGIRGGTGNFGIVTSLEFRLYPVKEFYGGSVFFPAENAREVLQAYGGWVNGLPDTLTSRAVIYNLPPIPVIPEPLRGRWTIAVQGVFLGSETEGADLLQPIRKVAKPVLDTFAMMPYSKIDTIANDPQQPTAIVLQTETLRDISPQMIDSLLQGVRVGERSFVVQVEMRDLGGALAAFPANGSAVGCPLGKFWLNAIAMFRTPEEKTPATQEVARVKEAVEPFSTGRVFLNGLSGVAGSARVRSAYSPENYERLVALKRRYDPDNLFRFNCNIDPSA